MRSGNETQQKSSLGMIVMCRCVHVAWHLMVYILIPHLGTWLQDTKNILGTKLVSQVWKWWTFTLTVFCMKHTNYHTHVDAMGFSYKTLSWRYNWRAMYYTHNCDMQSGILADGDSLKSWWQGLLLSSVRRGGGRTYMQCCIVQKSLNWPTGYIIVKT